MFHRSFRTAVAIIAFAVALPACAQPAPTAVAEAKRRAPGDADPALWVVKDSDTTVYLFGTIHVLKPGLTWFDEAVKTAFDRSNTLVLELVAPDPAAMQAIIAARGVTLTGPTLTERLPPDKRAAYAQALADGGMPAAALDRMKPWLAAVSLSMGPLRTLGYDPANGPETVLTAAAQAAGKPVIGLETADQQFGFFDGLSAPAQMIFLTSTIDELPEVEGTMATMITDWSNGDPDALAREMNESLKNSPEVAAAILTNRNATWARWIAERMKRPGTVFVAVGAGHLAGPDSVQAKLRPLKLTAERVAY